MPVTLYPGRGGLRVPQGAGSYPGRIAKVYHAPGLPPDSLGDKDDLYIDTSTGRKYLKRLVGNLLNDAVNVPAAGPADGTTGQWTCELVFRALNLSSDEYGFFANLTATNLLHTRLQWYQNAFRFSLRNNTGGSAYQVISSIRIDDSNFHKVVFGVGEGIFFISVDNETLNAASTQTWSPGVATKSRMTDLDPAVVDSTIQIASCRVYRPAGDVYNLAYNDGSGSTVSDISGNGNHGVITDGNPTDFWKTVWCPMDHLA